MSQNNQHNLFEDDNPEYYINDVPIYVKHTPSAPIPDYEKVLEHPEYKKITEWQNQFDPGAEELGIEADKDFLTNGKLRRDLALKWGQDLHKEFQKRDKEFFTEKEKTLYTSDGKRVRPDGISISIISEGEPDGRILKEIKTYIPRDGKLKPQLEKMIDASEITFGRKPEGCLVEIYEPGNIKDIVTNRQAYIEAYEQQKECDEAKETVLEEENETELERELEGESDEERENEGWEKG